MHSNYHILGPSHNIKCFFDKIWLVGDSLHVIPVTIKDEVIIHSYLGRSFKIAAQITTLRHFPSWLSGGVYWREEI